MHVLSWNILAPSLFLTYWREYYAGDETESEAGADVDAYFATVVEAKAIGVACAIEDMIGQFNPDVICLQETTVLGAANLTFGSPRLHAAIMEHDVRWKQLLAAKGYTLVSHTRKPHLQAFKIPVRNEEMQDRGRIGTTGVMIFARIDSRDGYCAVQGGGSADCIVPASIIVQSTEVASSRGVQTTPVVAVEFQVKNAISDTRSGSFVLAASHVVMNYPHNIVGLQQVWQNVVMQSTAAVDVPILLVGDLNAGTPESQADTRNWMAQYPSIQSLLTEEIDDRAFWLRPPVTSVEDQEGKLRLVESSARLLHEYRGVISFCRPEARELNGRLFWGREVEPGFGSSGDAVFTRLRGRIAEEMKKAGSIWNPRQGGKDQEKTMMVPILTTDHDAILVSLQWE